jgi:hypothetical protein
VVGNEPRDVSESYRSRGTRQIVHKHSPNGYPCPFEGLPTTDGSCPAHDLGRVRIAEDYGEETAA